MSFNVFFTEIERIQLASVRGEHLVTIQLKNHTLPGQQKCFLFECHCLSDFAACLEFHCPSLATPCPRDDIRSQEVTSPHSKILVFIDLVVLGCQNEDWLSLSDRIASCRLELVRKKVVRAHAQTGSGFIRSALNRFDLICIDTAVICDVMI